jgi:mono/diheme cytochrome c family protein
MKWLIRGLGGLAVVLLLAGATLFVISNGIIKKRYPFKEYAITLPTDSASLALGARMVQMRCVGCHGDSLEGRSEFVNEPMIARIGSPNVLAKLATLTDAEFAGFMRSGVRKDGTSSFVMPPPGFYHISDADLAALTAYLRKMPLPGTPLPPPNRYGPMGRLGVVMGQFKPVVAAFDTTQERVGQDPAWATTRNGEYLARLICTECHGTNLAGAAGPPAPTPSLSGALGYSPEEFKTLLRTGTPRSPGTQLTLMASMARLSLTHLTDSEISAIYEYIKAMPATGVASR